MVRPTAWLNYFFLAFVFVSNTSAQEGRDWEAIRENLFNGQVEITLPSWQTAPEIFRSIVPDRWIPSDFVSRDKCMVDYDIKDKNSNPLVYKEWCSDFTGLPADVHGVMYGRMVNVRTGDPLTVLHQSVVIILDDDDDSSEWMCGYATNEGLSLGGEPNDNFDYEFGRCDDLPKGLLPLLHALYY